MLTAIEYAELSARNARYNRWAEQFRKPNGWTVISAAEQETCPPDARITNEERSAIEMYEFVNDPPDKYFAYVREADSTLRTWAGDKLGTIGFGRPFRSSFGDTRVPIRVRAINGRTYSGTYYKSAGDYCRLRAVKESPRAPIARRLANA